MSALAAPLEPLGDARAYLDAAASAILITDADLSGGGPCVRYVNAAFERMTGWPRHEIVGRTPRLLQGPETDPGIFRDMRARLAAGESWAGETVNYRRDGTPFVMAWSISPVTDPDGQVCEYMATLADVSARRRSERARERELAESERRFRALFDLSFQFVGLLAPDGTLLDSNRSSLAFGGTTLAAVRGRPFWDTPWWQACPATRERVRASVAQVADGAFVRFPAVARGADGRRYTVDFSLKPVRDAAGEVVLLIPEGRDITELVEQQADLQRSAARMRNAQRIGRMGSWDYDPARDRLAVDGDLRQLFGLEAFGRVLSFAQFRGLVHPDDLARVEAAVAEALASGTDYDVVYHLCVPGQPERVIHAVAEVQRDGRGAVAGLLGVAQDVTQDHGVRRELIAARNAAEAASEAKSRFLAVMGHELRTPLNAINGFSGLIADEVLGPLGAPAYREYARTIHDSGAHLLQVINAILEASRIDFGQAQPQDEPVATRELLDSVGRMLGASLADKTVGLDLVPGPEVVLRGDARMLRQVLLNLAGNAVKFAPAGSAVRLEGRLEDDGGYSFVVTDQGPGIPAADRERVTMAFVQGDDRLQRSHPGVGLGLYLVTSFLGLHGGRLELACPPAGGTIATARLPGARVSAGA